MTLYDDLIELMSRPVPTEEEMVEEDAQRMLNGTFWHVAPMTERERTAYLRKVAARHEELCAGD